MTVPKEVHGAPSTVADSPNPEDLQELFSALSTATDALRRSHDELLSRVEDLERELARKNRALERKRRLEALGKIAAGVAHEIRNPLGSLSLYLDLLEREVNGNVRAAQLLEKMRRGVSLLSSTVNDVLTFTEPGRMRVAEYDPVAVVEESLSLVIGASGGRIELVRHYPAESRSARGDPSWLRRIFVNLIRNAFQAMPEGGRLEITVAYGEEITVKIRDTGPGIDPEDLEHVFLPFWGKRDGGTGLGLSIVHSLAERHQGRIELTNHPEGGAVAVVQLPWDLKHEND